MNKSTLRSHFLALKLTPFDTSLIYSSTTEDTEITPSSGPILPCFGASSRFRGLFLGVWPRSGQTPPYPRFGLLREGRWDLGSMLGPRR
jgi:hypothetical protein